MSPELASINFMGPLMLLTLLYYHEQLSMHLTLCCLHQSDFLHRPPRSCHFLLLLNILHYFSFCLDRSSKIETVRTKAECDAFFATVPPNRIAFIRRIKLLL